MKENIKNVICIKWGSYYKADSVNKLYNMVKRHTKYIINFYCFTDDSSGLYKDIIVKPLPQLNVKDLRYAYIKEAGLCDDELGGLRGQRVLYFDLDTLIVNNIDCFFELPKDNDFYIINDWNTRGNSVGQASCYSWVVGTLGFVKKYFEENYLAIYKKFYTASQEYLSSQVISHFGKLNFWPESWCKSFKVHCLPSPFIPFARRFKMAKIPNGGGHENYCLPWTT